MVPEKQKESSPTTLTVHRCRFVDYAPSAITALAFPPLPLPSVQRKRRKGSRKQSLRQGTLVVGHANGSIDLCEWSGSEQSVQCSQAWVVRKTMPGPYPSKVDSLTFVIRHPDDLDIDDVPSTSDLRLFSSGGGSELLEWSLEKSCVRRTISSQGGAIWCVAANPASTFLALGCEDGTVRLLSVVNDTLTHYRRFDRVKCRVLSIAWGPPVPRSRDQPLMNEDGSDSGSEDDEDDWHDSWLVTGCSDSSLRKWDTKTGRALERMAVDRIRGERTLVWTVGVLGDGTIVSGDSLGHVRFWNSRTCTQLHAFQAHAADVLTLAINPEGKAIYTSGVDQKVVQFSLVRTNASSTTTSLRWAQTASRRMHSHDVRTLASWPPYTPLPSNYNRTFPLDVAPILASGGLDMSVVLSPAALPESTVMKVINPLSTSVESTFGDAYHRRLAYTVGNAIRISRNRRLLLCLREAGLSVWRILKKPESDPADPVRGDDTEPWNGGWEKVLEMDLIVASNLIVGEISEDGRWLAVSDMYEAKLFSLHTDEQKEIFVKRVKDFPALVRSSIPDASSGTSAGAMGLCFSPDSSKLVLSTAQTSYILIFDLASNTPRLLRRFEHHRFKDIVIGDRVVKSLKEQRQPNGIVTNGAHASREMDVEMGDVEDEVEDSEPSEESEEDDSDEAHKNLITTAIPSVLRITISPDGQWLATSDDQRRTHIFNLDSISHHGLLPTFPLPVQSFIFSPTATSVLFLSFPDNTLQVYDVEARQFPLWSNDLSLSSSPPSPIAVRLASLHDSILGICFPPPPLSPPDVMDAGNGGCTGMDIEKSQYALLWGANWLLKLPLSLSTIGCNSKTGKKRRRAQAATQDHFDAEVGGVMANEESLTNSSTKLITHYRPILHVDFLCDGELVVVERPLVDVLNTLPPAYFKHKYGSS